MNGMAWGENGKGKGEASTASTTMCGCTMTLEAIISDPKVRKLKSKLNRKEHE